MMHLPTKIILLLSFSLLRKQTYYGTGSQCFDTYKYVYTDKCPIRYHSSDLRQVYSERNKI